MRLPYWHHLISPSGIGSSTVSTDCRYQRSLKTNNVNVSVEVQPSNFSNYLTRVLISSLVTLAKWPPSNQPDGGVAVVYTVGRYTHTQWLLFCSYHHCRVAHPNYHGANARHIQHLLRRWHYQKRQVSAWTWLWILIQPSKNAAIWQKVRLDGCGILLIGHAQRREEVCLTTI